MTTNGGMMTVADQARADQAEAKEREFDRKTSKAAMVLLVLGVLLGAYSALGINDMVPLPDWSPAGSQQEMPAPERPVIEIPEGWEPAVPVPDGIEIREPSTDI